MLRRRGSKRKPERLKKISLSLKQRSQKPNLKRRTEQPKARLRQRRQKNLPRPRLRVRRLLLLEAKMVKKPRAKTRR